MKHGGDILTYKDAYEGELLDFSSNINPLGFPVSVRGALVDGINDLKRYPDIMYRELRHEIGSYLGCEVNKVILGNGAVEIIDNLIMMFKRVVVYVPCFCEYVDRARIHGKETVLLPLDGDFGIDVKLLGNAIKPHDIVILGNPNNPSGKRIPLEKLMQIAELVKAAGAFLLLDEAFYEFCPDDYDSIKIFAASKAVCVIRAATKFFALPGIRLGYGFISVDIVEKYSQNVLPWNINALANTIGMKIFKETEFISKSRKYMSEQREYLLAGLKKLNNLFVYDTDCNFILIELLHADEDMIFDYFLKRGIILRKASNFEGLDDAYIRVAIRSGEENKRLLECFKEFETENNCTCEVLTLASCRK